MKTPAHSIQLIHVVLLLLTVLPFAGFHPGDTDTISVIRAEYDSATSTLAVEATSSNPKSVLEVYETKKERLIGTLNKGERGTHSANFSVPANPRTITLKSSQGGSVVVDVEAR